MSENNTSPAENTTSLPPELPQGPIYKRAYKSMWIAYVLALLGGAGCFGLHRFYLGYNRSALVILVLTLGGILLPMIGIRSVTLTWWVVSIWVLVDLFLIPAMTRTRNAEIAAEIDRDLKDQI
ncbi:TM2 domain-containing protein [Rhizobium panacihumi]|uniref:TM2 domain-containing protein n=1 Tax=Rhizobium panacihumi TaxID=2008450 RepID=UPI003D79D8F1